MHYDTVIQATRIMEAWPDFRVSTRMVRDASIASSRSPKHKAYWARVAQHLQTTMKLMNERERGELRLEPFFYPDLREEEVYDAVCS